MIQASDAFGQHGVSIIELRQDFHKTWDQSAL